MSERERLIQRLKYLIREMNKKQEEYRKNNNLGDECAFLTKEGMMIASLYPKMRDLDVSFEDCK